MTPVLPLGYKVWPQCLFTFRNPIELVFQMRYPNQTSQLTLYNFTLREDAPGYDIVDKTSLINRYGPWIPENWPDYRRNRTPVCGNSGTPTACTLWNTRSVPWPAIRLAR